MTTVDLAQPPAKNGAAKVETGTSRPSFLPHVFTNPLTGNLHTDQAATVIVPPAAPGMLPGDVEVRMTFKTKDVTPILRFVDDKLAMIPELTREKLLQTPQYDVMKRIVGKMNELSRWRGELVTEQTELNQMEQELTADDVLLSDVEVAAESLTEKAVDLVMRQPEIKDKISGADKLLDALAKRKATQKAALLAVAKTIRTAFVEVLLGSWEAVKQQMPEGKVDLQDYLLERAQWGVLAWRLQNAKDSTVEVEMITNALMAELESGATPIVRESRGTQILGMPGHRPVYESGPAGSLSGVVTPPVELMNQ
jgi:hypothetical protein